MKFHLIFILVLMFSIVSSHAAEENSQGAFLQSLNYPELEVTPLASETVREEAKNERLGRWVVHAPLQVSAISTIMASMNMAKDPDKEYSAAQTEAFDNGKMIGNLMGYGWLVTTIALSATYTPYMSGYKDLKKYKGDNKKDKLARERLAERTMRRSAELGRKLKWMSFCSQIIANAYMMSLASSETLTYPAVGVLLSFAPLVFDYHWADIYNEHQINKKKIYGPVASLGVVASPDRKAFVPGLNLSYSF